MTLRTTAAATPSIALFLSACSLINPTATFTTDVADSGMLDSGMLDSGMLDSGMLDSGTDAGDDAGIADAGVDSGIDACVGSRTLVIAPDVIGHVVEWPELGMRDTNRAGMIVLSAYFKTTADNREFRRGIAEFVVPEDVAEAIAARLTFRTATAPTEDHVVLAYTGANSLVTVMDYDRAASFVGRVITEEVAYSFDVLPFVAMGFPLGFRFQYAPPLDTATDDGARALTFEDVRLEIEYPCF